MELWSTDSCSIRCYDLIKIIMLSIFAFSDTAHAVSRICTDVKIKEVMYRLLTGRSWSLKELSFRLLIMW